jgi:hypothetical protein
MEFLKSLGCNIGDWVMCYPHGAYDDSAISILEKNNCAVGLSIDVGIANLDKNNPMSMPRLNTNDLPKDSGAKPNQWTLKVL